jgi:type I restriction enzyme S subunit
LFIDIFSIPGWKTKKLDDVIELCYGKALPQSTRQKGDVPVYGSNGIVGHHSKSLISFPTVVVGRKGSVGKAHYAEKSCWVIDTAYYVKTKTDDIDLRFIYHFLKGLESIFDGTGKGVKPGINREDYLKTEITLPFKSGKPDLTEQKRTADELDKVFASSEQLENLFGKQEQSFASLRSSVLNQSFQIPT